jgi:sugar phosphate isomerase/epimerase
MAEFSLRKNGLWKGQIMQSINRRTFLANFVAVATLGFNGCSSSRVRGEPTGAADSDSAEKSHHPNRIAVSTYSFWRFKEGLKLPIETCIDEASAMGFDGVEILHIQMEKESNDYLQGLKRRALINGIDLCGFSIHQGFISPDKEKRQQNIDHTIKCIEMAYQLGIPIIRINTGRWGTTKSFDELMANRGIEPVLPGYADEDGFKWVVDSIQKCLLAAEKCGVILGLENHWGLARTPEGLLRIISAVNSPWLRVLLDAGNFLEDPYNKIEQCAPYAVFMHAKTYFGGGIWYTLDLDYPRIARIMRRHNFRGYLSLEYEGNEDYKTAIPKSLALLRKAFS